MKALFLESKAAAQITMYAESVGLPADGLAEMLENGYKYGRKCPNNFRWSQAKGITYDDWWVTMCLKNDSHKSVDIDSLISWTDTPEGFAFWKNVYRFKVDVGEFEEDD